MNNVKSKLLLAFAGILLLTQPGVDCLSDGGSSGSGTGSGRSDPIRNDGPSNSRNDADYDRYNVDRRAEVAQDFPRGDFNWSANTSGQFWVYDLDERRVIDSNFIRRGEKLRASPAENRIWVDGETVSRHDLKQASRHRVYFLADNPRMRDRRQWNDKDRDDRDRDDRASNDRDRDAKPQPGKPSDSNVGPQRPPNSGVVTGLPQSAQLLAQGQGSDLNLNITNAGKIYVVDMSQNKLLDSFDVSPTQKVKLDSRVGKVFRDGREMLKGLSSKNNYRIYFVRR
jgi:hypothetical protein